VLKPPGIACRVPSGDANVNGFARTGYWRATGTTSPSPTPTPGGGGTSTPTITIANNAVSPKSITVTRGSQVTFVNNDNQAHDMESDPHPIHTDCPEINQVGFLSPGQSRRTGTLNIARTCGYHDHNRDMVESLQGTIVIQ
jgi:plastocyanin